jgi:Big-like domain-containing protein/WD40 repeat protein
MQGRPRWGLLVGASLAALAALPATASAVLSGTNGRIVFASGRGATAGDDSTAKLFLRPTIGSIGAGTASPIPTATGANQHRHPTWAPDRTMIAYAHGDNNCRPDDVGMQPESTNCALYVLDLTDPNATPQNITGIDNIADDRPAWSPDGTKIAYETELADNSGQEDIVIDEAPFGSPDLNLTNTAGAFDGKPAWTPDSQTLYYVIGNPNTAGEMRIVSEPAGGGSVTNITVAGAPAEFQPSISPDGTRMCFTRGSTFGASDARVIVALANGGGSVELPGTSGVASYNCTWSPDGTKIAYVQGVFTQGDLVMENSDASGNNFFVLENTASHFDGNPDWAPDGRPHCEDATVTTTVNTPVQVPVACPDTGPEYEQTDVRAVYDTNPSNGTVSPDPNDPNFVAFLLPTNVTYTPKNNFVGTDTFTVLAFDEVAFAENNATLTINVQRVGRTITLDANKNNVKKGKKVTLSGDVNASANASACEANQTVELQRKKPSQGSFTTFQQLQTNGQGGFSLKTKVKKTFQYEAVLGQTQVCEDATSDTEKVKAKKKKKK